MMEQRLIGLPKIFEFPEYPIQRNNRLALESGALKMIRKVRPDWPRADIILVSLSHSDKISCYDNILLGGYTDDKTQMVLIKVYGDSLEVASTSKADEIGLMRLFAHLHLGPRVYATFSNGMAYEYVAGQALNYAVAVDKNVYPIIAQKIGQMHRAMSSYAASDVLHPSQASTHVFHTLRNWLMMVPMRLADPANHYRMVSEMPTKATLVNELDELELRILHSPPTPSGSVQMPYIEPKLVFCHNDLSPENIIYDPVSRNVSFLHLEYADVNFQAFELARHFYTLSGTDKVGFSEYVPAREFQMRWIHYYLAAYENVSVRQVNPEEIENLHTLVQKFALVFLLQEIIWSLIKVEDATNQKSKTEFDILGYGIKRFQQYKKSKYNIVSMSI